MPHILVVDDDREIRDLLARFLEEKHRMRVTAVRDTREARRAFANGHYHLVVLDLMLPGEGGLDFARWLRSQSDVPIVMLTAMGEETDRIIGLELGADDYVPKPLTRANCWPASAPSCAAPAMPQNTAPMRLSQPALRRLDAGAGAPPPGQPGRRRGRADRWGVRPAGRPGRTRRTAC